MFDRSNSELDKQHFERNRYIKEDFLTEFEKIKTLDKIIRLSISSIDAFEIYIADEEIAKKFITEVIAEIPNFDNFVQDFCERNSEMTNLGYKNYRVGLSWLSIEQNKVSMGYCGEYVNIELRVIFVKNDLKWGNEDIYWQ